MPSRLSPSAPLRATSAATLRTTIGPTATRSSRTSAALAAPLAVTTSTSNSSRARVEAELRRVLGAQHDGRGAGVEQHRDARAVDRRRHDEFAAEAAVDDHLAASADLRLAGEEFAHQPFGEIGGFEAIGVDADQAEDDRRPAAAPPNTRASARRAGAPRAGERQPDEERDSEGGAGEAARDRARGAASLPGRRAGRPAPRRAARGEWRGPCEHATFACGAAGAGASI